MEEKDEREALDYDTLQERQDDELTALLDLRDAKGLKARLLEMNEFDVAEFLSELDAGRMLRVFLSFTSGRILLAWA